MLKFGSSRRSGVAVSALLGVSLLSVSAWAQDNGQAPPPNPQRPAIFSATAPDFFDRLQPVTPESVAPAPALYRVEFPIRNVKASLMAYWLEPATHAMPVDLRISELLGGGANPYMGLGTKPYLVDGGFKSPNALPRLPGNGKGPDEVKLPEGVTRIVAIDPRNELLVEGSKEGLKALSVLLPTLDVPLVQYEIEAQFLSIRRADLGALGVDFGEQPVEPKVKIPRAISALGFGEAQGQSPLSFGAVASVGNIQASIAKLIADGRLKVVTAPRVTAVDGLTAQLVQTTSTPFVLTTPPGVKAVVEEPARQSVAYLTTSIGIRATPVRIKDEQLSLSITPTLGTRTLSVSATVRDGQSFAIQMSPATDDNQIVVIVTTRKIRRVADNA